MTKENDMIVAGYEDLFWNPTISHDCFENSKLSSWLRLTFTFNPPLNHILPAALSNTTKMQQKHFDIRSSNMQYSFLLLYTCKPNHYQHTGDRPSVRCMMLKYAGTSILQLSMTEGTLVTKSKCPCSHVEQRSLISASCLGQYFHHCSSQRG